MDSTDEAPSVLARELEPVLGYRFRRDCLLRRALTHSSSTADKHCDNERLEFFGDAVLDFVVCEHLFRTLPFEREGRLTEIRSLAVRRRTLSEAARGLGLREHLILGKGISSRRSLPQSLLGNVFEALVAAVYLDGGMEAAREFVMRHLGETLEAAMRTAGSGNYKSLLQERVQRESHESPQYVLLRESGPDHAREFEVAVRIGGREYGPGHGSSKKDAEQEAARLTLERMDEPD